jgi:uncharacterized protein YutE (UPF0331/DUF86 family)
LNRLDRRRSLSHYWTSPSHQFWRTQGEKQPSHSYKQPGQTVKAAGLARTMSGALIPWSDIARLRDLLAHRYFDTSHSILQATVDHDLPALNAAILRLLNASDEE